MTLFRRGRLLPTLALLALSFSFTPSALADNLADEADLQFKLGADAYQKGDFSGALEHFLASNRLVPNRNVIFDIARSYEELHNAPSAYRYYVEALDGETRADQKQRIEEALKRIAPSVAVLKVTTDPPGATVYLDRKDLGSRGNTPRNLGLGAGRHKIMVELPGYEPAEKADVDLVVGKEADVDFKLVAILGTVKIDGENGAQVRLDSEEGPILGTIPCTVQVPPGRHMLYVQKLGYQVQNVPIDVPPRGNVVAHARLAAQTGAVVVNTDIRDALVSIDDQPSGFTPAVLRQMMDTLREYFRRRLSETLDDAGDLRLLTDGHGLFLRTRQGHIFDLLVDPQQPLVTGDGLPLSPVVGRARRKARSLKPEARSKR